MKSSPSIYYISMNTNTPGDSEQHGENSNEDNTNQDNGVLENPHNISLSPESSHTTSAISSTSSTIKPCSTQIRTLVDIYEDYSEFLFLNDDKEPTSYSTEKGIVEWEESMKSELSVIEKNKT